MAETQETYESDYTGEQIDGAVCWASQHSASNPTTMSVDLAYRNGKRVAINNNFVESNYIAMTSTEAMWIHTGYNGNVTFTAEFTTSGGTTIKKTMTIQKTYYGESHGCIVLDDLFGGKEYPTCKTFKWKIVSVSSGSLASASAWIGPRTATYQADGILAHDDKEKLDGIETGAQKNPSTATSSRNGLMAAGDKKKLDNLATIFGDDILIRTSGISCDVVLNETCSFGFFHLKRGERFQVTSDDESNIEIKSSRAEYLSEISANRGTAESEESDVTIYDEFLITENHALSASLTIKIV